MNFKSFETTGDTSFETSAVRLYHELQKEILTGKLPPGTRLIRRELGKRFELSQSTVSEALWRLESDGLVESAPMYGTRVCHMTMERVRNELVLREALECEVARLVTETLLPKHEQPLLDLAAAVDEAMSEGSQAAPEEGMDTHRAFHMELVKITGYELLVREVDLIWRRHFVLFNWISAHVLPVPANWHRTLLTEIFARDPDRAERAMRAHVRYGKSQQLRVLAEVNKLSSHEESALPQLGTLSR
jgi:GntR family transcriptional regulator, rspAB operon transcriptional repressor